MEFQELYDRLCLMVKAAPAWREIPNHYKEILVPEKIFDKYLKESCRLTGAWPNSVNGEIICTFRGIPLKSHQDERIIYKLVDGYDHRKNLIMLVKNENEPSIELKQLKIIAQFDQMTDNLDKIQHIINLGKKLPPMQEFRKTDANRIVGCQSKVWLDAEFNNGVIDFYADAELNAQMSKGMISLLLSIFNGHSPEEIVKADLFFIQRIGMSNLITSTRSGGLASMIQKIKTTAKSHCQ